METRRSAGGVALRPLGENKHVQTWSILAEYLLWKFTNCTMFEWNINGCLTVITQTILMYILMRNKYEHTFIRGGHLVLTLKRQYVSVSSLNYD